MTTLTRPLFCVDLDDTLFQTAGKCPPHIPVDLLTIVATAKMGKHSYMTPSQVAMIEWLLATTDVVPVTARSSSAFDAITVKFQAGAILSNGALIRNADGSVDAVWQEIINADLAHYRDTLKLLLEQGRASAAANGIDVRSLNVGENGVLAYVVFKDNDGPGEALNKIQFDDELVRGWTRHHNGNNLALIPPVLSKRRATQYLIGKYREDEPHKPVFGLGDSVSDIPFLQLCDWWGMPARSQIADTFTSIVED